MQVRASGLLLLLLTTALQAGGSLIDKNSEESVTMATAEEISTLNLQNKDNNITHHLRSTATSLIINSQDDDNVKNLSNDYDLESENISQTRHKIDLISSIDDDDLLDGSFTTEDLLSTESQIPLISLFENVDISPKDPKNLMRSQMRSVKYYSTEDFKIPALSPSTLESVRNLENENGEEFLKPFLLRSKKDEEVKQIITMDSDNIMERLRGDPHDDNDHKLHKYFSKQRGFRTATSPSYTRVYSNEYTPIRNVEANAISSYTELDNTPSDRFHNMVSALSDINPALYAGLRLPYYSLISKDDEIDLLYRDRDTADYSIYEIGIPFESKRLSNLDETDHEGNIAQNNIENFFNVAAERDQQTTIEEGADYNEEHLSAQERMDYSTTDATQAGIETYELINDNSKEIHNTNKNSGSFLSAFQNGRKPSSYKAKNFQEVSKPKSTPDDLKPIMGEPTREDDKLKQHYSLTKEDFVDELNSFDSEKLQSNEESKILEDFEIVGSNHDNRPLQTSTVKESYLDVIELLPSSLHLKSDGKHNEYILQESARKSVYADPDASVFGNVASFNRPLPSVESILYNEHDTNEHSENNYDYYGDYYEYNIATPQSVSKSLQIDKGIQSIFARTSSPVLLNKLESGTKFINSPPSQSTGYDDEHHEKNDFNGNKLLYHGLANHIEHPATDRIEADTFSINSIEVPNNVPSYSFENGNKHFAENTESSYTSYNFKSILDEILETTPGVTDVTTLLTPVTARPAIISVTHTPNQIQESINKKFNLFPATEQYFDYATINEANIYKPNSIGEGKNIHLIREDKFQASPKTGDPQAFTPLFAKLNTTRNPQVVKYSTPIPLPNFPYIPIHDDGSSAINHQQQKHQLNYNKNPVNQFPYASRDINLEKIYPELGIQGFNSLSNSQKPRLFETVFHSIPAANSPNLNFNHFSSTLTTPYIATPIFLEKNSNQFVASQPNQINQLHSQKSLPMMTTFSQPAATIDNNIDSKFNMFENINDGLQSTVPTNYYDENKYISKTESINHHRLRNEYPTSENQYISLPGKLQDVILQDSTRGNGNIQQGTNFIHQVHQYGLNSERHLPIFSNYGGINKLNEHRISSDIFQNSPITYDQSFQNIPNNFKQHIYEISHPQPNYNHHGKNTFANLQQQIVPYYTLTKPISPLDGFHNSYPQLQLPNNIYPQSFEAHTPGSPFHSIHNVATKNHGPNFVGGQERDYDHLALYPENKVFGNKANIEVLPLKNLKEIIFDNQGRLIDETFYEDNVYDGEPQHRKFHSEVPESTIKPTPKQSDDASHVSQGTTNESSSSSPKEFLNDFVGDFIDQSTSNSDNASLLSEDKDFNSNPTISDITTENIPNFIEDFISVTPIGDNGLVKPTTSASTTKIDLTTIADIVRPKGKPNNDEVSIFTTLREAIRGIASHPSYLILPNEKQRNLPTILAKNNGKNLLNNVHFDSMNENGVTNKRKMKDFVLILSESDADILPQRGDYSIVLPKTLSGRFNSENSTLSKANIEDVNEADHNLDSSHPNDPRDHSIVPDGHIISGKIELNIPNDKNGKSLLQQDVGNQIDFDSINMIQIDDVISFLESTMGKLREESRDLLKERFKNDSQEIHLDTPIYLWRPGLKEGFGVRLLDNMHFVIPRSDVEKKFDNVIETTESGPSSTTFENSNIFPSPSTTVNDFRDPDQFAAKYDYDFTGPDVNYFRYDYELSNSDSSTTNQPSDHVEENLLRSNAESFKKSTQTEHNTNHLEIINQNTESPIEISTVTYIVPSIADNFVKNLENLFRVSASEMHAQLTLPESKNLNAWRSSPERQIGGIKSTNSHRLNKNEQLNELVNKSNRSAHFFSSPEIIESVIQLTAAQNISSDLFPGGNFDLNFGLQKVPSIKNTTSENASVKELRIHDIMNVGTSTNSNIFLQFSLPVTNSTILVPEDPILLVDDVDWSLSFPPVNISPKNQQLNTISSSINIPMASVPMNEGKFHTQQSSNNFVQVSLPRDPKLNSVNSVITNGNNFNEDSKINRPQKGIHRMVPSQRIRSRDREINGQSLFNNQVFVPNIFDPSINQFSNLSLFTRSSLDIFPKESSTKSNTDVNQKENNILLISNILPGSKDWNSEITSDEERYWLWKNNGIRRSESLRENNNMGSIGMSKIPSDKSTEQDLDILLSGLESQSEENDYLLTSSSETIHASKRMDTAESHSSTDDGKTSLVPEKLKNLLVNLHQGNPQQVQVSSHIRLASNDRSSDSNLKLRHVAGSSNSNLKVRHVAGSSNSNLNVRHVAGLSNTNRNLRRVAGLSNSNRNLRRVAGSESDSWKWFRSAAADALTQSPVSRRLGKPGLNQPHPSRLDFIPSIQLS